MVKLMDTGETECFPALSALSLHRVRGFSSEKLLFVQFIQVLFTDRVSRKLQTLELSGECVCVWQWTEGARALLRTPSACCF